ncbi:MAG: response regulator [Desulfobacterales bacterium]|nr:response regulator [Desulfobacterales bacterium]
MPSTPPLIVLVDDDPSVARGLDRLLRSWGMQVRTFGSGKEFLSAREELPKADCCVIDVQMPEMTGLEVQERLNRSGGDAPVIFITAHYDETIEWQALKAGAVGFLRKPFSDEILVGLIRKALKGRKTECP